MTFEELYGLSLPEYCDFLGITIDQLMNQNKKKIELIEKQYQTQYVDNRDNLDIDELEKAVELQNIIDYRKKHLKRLEEWANLSSTK